MPRESQDITEGELAVLQVLWDRPAASIRQITEALYPRNTASHYGTVQKQLERLEGKGFVRRDRSLFVHLFSASVDRDALVGRRPFEAQQLFQALHQVLHTEATPPSQLVPGLAKAVDLVFERALAKEADRRYSRAQEFARALEAAFEGTV